MTWKTIVALNCVAASATLNLLAHPHHATNPPVQLVAKNQAAHSAPVRGDTAQIVSGSGAFRYEYVPGKLVLPSSVRMKHGHGLCRDAQGHIYFTFEPEKVDSDTRALIRFEPDGTAPELLGTDNVLAQGVPHGLNIQVDKNGQTHLYHANNNATVHKTTLTGEAKWTRKWPPFMGNYKPTDIVVTPGSSRTFVADGYGSSMVHVLKDSDGVYAGKSWGGFGAEHGELNCPHGITYDPRRKLLLVSDRGNRRLEYFTLSGLYHSTVYAPEIIAPCNADIWKDYVLVPDLNGPLIILDRDNKVVSVIEVSKLLGAKGFLHPHDAIFLENGDIVVCTWAPGRLGYWRRLPE